MQQPACFDCRFFTTATWDKADDLAEADFDDCIQGHCRISPPRVGRFRGEGQTLKYDYGQWPLVLSGDWCGAFSPCQRALRDVADRSRHVAHAAHLGQLGQDGRTPAHTSRHVGPRSTISVEAEQGRDHAPVRGHVAEHQARQDG